MRFVVAVLLVTFSSAAAQTKPSPGWSKSQCFPDWYGTRPCLRVTPGDAAAIQKVVLAYLSPAMLKQHPTWRNARTLAAHPSSYDMIGHYLAELSAFDRFKGDVLRLTAVDHHENHAEHGFTIFVGRATPTAAWTVLAVTHYSRQPPQKD